MDRDLRSLIREILAEELRGLAGGGAHADTTPRPQVHEETVEIATDGDLHRFVLRVLEMAKDDQAVADIKAGRRRFRLSGDAVPAIGAVTMTRPGAGSVRFDRGLVTERHVASVPDGASVRVGPRVRVTPLALDAIRRRGLRLERKTV